MLKLCFICQLYTNPAFKTPYFVQEILIVKVLCIYHRFLKVYGGAWKSGRGEGEGFEADQGKEPRIR